MGEERDCESRVTIGTGKMGTTKMDDESGAGIWQCPVPFGVEALLDYSSRRSRMALVRSVTIMGFITLSRIPLMSEI